MHHHRSLGCHSFVGGVGLCETKPSGGGAGLATCSYIELAQDRGDVVIDRLRAHDQPVGDLGVAQPRGEQGQDLQLAAGQSGGVRAGAGARSARDSPFTQLTQAAGDDGLCRSGAEVPEFVERLAKRLGLTRVRQRQRRVVCGPAVAQTSGRPGPVAGEQPSMVLERP